MKWTKDSANQYIFNVNKKKGRYGLKFISACDFLKIDAQTAYTVTKKNNAQ